MTTKVSFFASEGDLPIQDATDAFGPVAGHTDTQYRLSSLFTGSATANAPMAFAVTAGKVLFFVSDSDATRYNIVVRLLLPIPGLPPVKYLIYRGILKSDFLDVNDAFVSGNTCRLKSVIASSRDPMQAMETYAAENGATPIDDLFLKQEHQFATVNPGDSIGHFDTTAGFHYGLDIVLDEPGYELTVAAARKSDNIIDTATAVADDAKEVLRFAALAYLDPAAFYGLCMHDAFAVDHNAKDPYRKEEIYRLVSKFATKNQIYLDIRDRWGLSYGLLGGTTTTLKISEGAGAATGATPVAYRDADNWPLHRLQNAFAAAANTGGYRRFTLKLSLALDGNTHPLLQLQSGYWSSYFPKMRDDVRFTKLKTSGTWTTDSSFTVIGAKEGAATVPAASYLRLQLTDYVDATALERQVPLLQPSDNRAFDFDAMFTPEWPPPPAMTTVTEPRLKTLVRMQPYLTYGIHKESGIAFRRGVAVDADGLVTFCTRGRHFIPLESNDAKAAGKIVSSTLATVLALQTGDFEDDGFWSLLTRLSAYQYDYLESTVIKKRKVESQTFKQRNLTKGVLRPYKLNLPSENANLLEIRVQDPMVVRGYDYSPAEPFTCLAYSTTERAAIAAIMNDPAKFSAVGPKLLVAGTTPVAITPASTRGHFKSTLQVRGLKYAGGQYTWGNETTGIDCYSVDGERYFTNAYATAVFNRVTGPVWNNAVVPDTVPPTTNPFTSTTKYGANFKTTLDASLNALVTVDARLLSGELRDALYDDDLGRATFEMAFRAPFFTERPREVPYTKVIINAVSKPNNPYIGNFEQWLADANALRAKQTTPALGALARTGLEKELTDAIDAARDHVSLYTTIDKARNTSLESHHVPAFMGRVMEDENPQADYVASPHLPSNHTHQTATYTTAGLAALVTAGTITAASKTYLAGLAANQFGWRTLSHPSPAGGYYIVKKSNSANFDITHTLTADNNSGVTIGLGFDMGQQTSATYSDYADGLGFPADATEALGKHRQQAAALFVQFDVDVWNLISMTYDVAVPRTVTLMETYLDEMLAALRPAVPAAKQILKVFQQTGGDAFYLMGTVQYFNEVEKAILLSHAYNAGTKSATAGNRTGRGLIHAVNTHDIRWLRIAWTRANVDIGRVYRMQAFLERAETAAHYDITKTAL